MQNVEFNPTKLLLFSCLVPQTKPLTLSSVVTWTFKITSGFVLFFLIIPPEVTPTDTEPVYLLRTVNHRENNIHEVSECIALRSCRVGGVNKASSRTRTNINQVTETRGEDVGGHDEMCWLRAAGFKLLLLNTLRPPTSGSINNIWSIPSLMTQSLNKLQVFNAPTTRTLDDWVLVWSADWFTVFSNMAPHSIY